VLVMGSLTLALGGVSAAASFWTLSAKSDFDARNGQPGATMQELTDLHDTARRRGDITNVLYGATAVSLGLTTLFIVLDSRDDSKDSKPPPAKIQVSGWAVGGGGGIVVGGKL
jgi:hypothetical protein